MIDNATDDHESIGMRVCIGMEGCGMGVHANGNRSVGSISCRTARHPHTSFYVIPRNVKSMPLLSFKAWIKCCPQSMTLSPDRFNLTAVVPQ